MFFNAFLKSTFLATIIVAAPFFVSAQAPQQIEKEANPKNPKNIIKIAPLAWIHGQVPFTVESRLGYERVIGQRSSVAGSYSYLGSNPVFGFAGKVALNATLTTILNIYGKPGKVGIVWEDTKIETSGYRYQFQYKHYLSKKTTAPEGFYLSPHYSYSQASYDLALESFDIEVSLKVKNRNYNLLAGYQALLGKHFMVDVFTGLGYKDKSTQIFDSEGIFLHKMPEGSALKFSSGFNIGWAF